jgi:hypothetical protein
MRRTMPIVMSVILATCATGFVASEWPRIDRSLVREPKYLHKPRYFLLVFGPEAKTRIWCVLDGSTLYVDRNGNGDLSESGERFTFRSDRPPQRGDASVIDVGDITETDGKTVHRHLRITRHTQFQGDSSLYIRVEVKGLYGMFTSIEVGEPMDRPQDAVFRHFSGPLRVLSDQDEFVRGDNPVNLYAEIGTCYQTEKAARLGALVGPGVMWTEICHDSKELPQDVHPVAEITFPPKRASDQPVLVKVPLSKRC